MLVAALRRFALLVLLVAGVTAALSLLIGALAGSSLDRAVSLGFYFMGCFMLISGFFVGNRGPSRVKSESAGPSMLPFPMFGARQLRWATLGEQNETMANSAVFVALGVILIVIGTLVDSRLSLF
jgi:hypothetical protein